MATCRYAPHFQPDEKDNCQCESCLIRRAAPDLLYACKTVRSKLWDLYQQAKIGKNIGEQILKSLTIAIAKAEGR